MLVLAALLAASAASTPPSPVGARLQSRATVRIVHGAAVRAGRVENGEFRGQFTGGEVVIADPDGRRFRISLTEFP